MEGFATGSFGTTLAFTLIVTVLLKATLLLGIVAGAAWVARKTAAATQHAIWRMGMIGLLLLPALALSLPALRVPVQAFERLTRPERVEPSFLKAAAGVTPTTPVEAVPAGVPRSIARHYDAPVPESREAVPVAHSATEGLAIGLLALWGVGVVVAVGRWMIGLKQVYRVTRAAHSEPRGHHGEVRCLSRRLGLQRPVRLLYSEGVQMPAHWGLWRPVVLLPAAAAQWDAERFRIVLLHELAHVKRWDYATHLAASLVRAIYWFNPIVLWAGRRLNLLQEQACDDVVLRAGTHAHVYAAALLDLARTLQSGRALPAAVAMAQAPTLKDRVRAILDRRDRAPRSAKATMLALAGIGLAAFPVAALRPGGMPPPTVEQEAVPPSPREENVQPEPAPPEALPASEAPAGPSYLWFEAEAGMLQAPLEARDDVRASGGRFLLVPDGEGNDAPEGGPGSVTFALDVVRSGVYHVWGRVIGDGGNDNSFYVSADEGPEVRWDILDEAGRARVRQWQWLPVVAGRTGAPVSYPFEAGPHTLRIRNREDGTRLDRLLITDDLTYRPSGTGPLPEGFQPVYLPLEGEAAQLAAPMQVGQDPYASGQAYVWGGRRAGQRGVAAFTFEVVEAGRYVVWGRARAPSEGANSFYVSLDGGEEMLWDVPGEEQSAKRWTWDRLSARQERRDIDPLLFDLAPGVHTLRVRTREDGTRLDQLLLTNDLSYRPRGARPLTPPGRPLYVWMEAETAHLTEPLRIGRDEAAGEGGFIAVARGHDSREAPPRDGRAAFRFDVAEQGRYTVWGRVAAQDSDEDSFWVRMDGGPWVRWNGIRRGEDWHWDEVHDSDYGNTAVSFPLEGGTHTLEVAYREEGARLDKVLVTNDPGFVPQGWGEAQRTVEVRFRTAP